MSVSKQLKLPDATVVKVFRALVDVIRADPVVSSALRPESLRTWEGDPADRKPFGQDQAPAVRLTMGGGDDQWFDPSAFVGELRITVEIVTKGLCQDDAQNLYWSIARAIYPKDQAKKLAIQLRLKTAGAETGLVRFTRPNPVPDEERGAFGAVGAISIRVIEPLNI